MKKCLGIFKTNQTMYLDYERCYWDIDKPWGRYKCDYSLMKKGTILKAYELDERDEVYNIELIRGNHTVYFVDLEDVKKCNWLEELKEENIK